jgi:O-methyltransferase involved in polyketide biosynthesis
LIWEGATNYLTEDAVDRSLRQIGEIAAKGSVLVFTYIERAVLESPERFFGAPKLIARAKSYGEPWTFGLDPGELRAYLARRGFELVQDVSAAEIRLSSGRSGSGIRGYEFYRLASAGVGG